MDLNTELKQAISQALLELRQIGCSIDVCDKDSQDLYEKIASCHDKLKSSAIKAINNTAASR